MAKSKEDELVKCSFNLPRPVWREAKIRAMDEGRQFQEIIAAAVREYCSKPLKAAAGGNR
jgi:hypothetical protein